MRKIVKPWIKLKGNIDSEDYELVHQLQERCVEHDQTALKLELDYKLGVTGEKNGVQNINEFMYFDGERLIGYIGVCSFGGPWEVNGMVDHEYRRQGVFTKLFELVLAEAKRRDSKGMLLLSDRQSDSGQKFITATGARYKHSEYEMYLKGQPAQQQSALSFRKATNADAMEIARQNAIYFNDEQEVEVNPEDLIMPEEEEKRGMTAYLAEMDGQIVGKVNLQLTSKLGAIFGLGVLPEHRRKGFGREILLMGVGKLKEANAKEIMLQVAAENSNALNLYKSCGFVETSTMDYYDL
ncbi:GNAT family N-acetyltransferase [Bacillus sp. T33-2]|uniref:GNAT family N-acetyltransferase n=1 Tax=Bacillus sp. T33-2 TaxID=2054168 RepID=UPI000C7684B0|nr:GNAT family N-acetyltransferase [Bacillus sp. T33-2]PLR94612.1 GNAT family N-acetyltransferase [Bacillus sp. T33-2]